MFLFSVVLPGMNSEGKRTEFNPLSEHDGLIERYKSKNLDGVLEVKRDSFIKTTPTWLILSEEPLILQQ